MYILDLLELIAQAELFDNAKEHLILLPNIFQQFLLFVFRLLVLFRGISPTSHRSSHFILDGPVGTLTHTVISTM